MSYTITIGQRIPHQCEDENCCDGYTFPDGVADAELEEAPAFPGDWASHKNYRSPSYIGWHEVTQEAGFESLWYSKPDGLLAEHPGCVTLTEDHYRVVHTALERWQATHHARPGFTCDPFGLKGWDCGDDCGSYDPILPRLLWLDWWMRWALDHCEWPSVANT